MRKFITALFLCLTLLSASASDSNEHWVQVQSAHFTVLTDSNEKTARRLAGQFEQMRSVFHVLFPNGASDEGSIITVIALKDRKGFQTFEPEAYLAKGQINLAGLFLRAPDKNYILLRLDTEGPHPYSSVYHEYTHFMFSKATWLPLWLNEGLAQFFQNTDIHDKDVVLGQATAGEILYLRQNTLIPLQTLLMVDHSSPYYHEEQKGNIFYAESWVLTHYLQVTDHEKNTHRLTDYANLLIKGEDPVTAAQHAFGDLEKLQVALQFYVRQNDFNSFPMSSRFTTDVSAFQMRDLSPSDANAVRADFFLYTQRAKEAEALLATVLRDDPNNALAHETMGFLKYREQDIPAARKWFSEAVQLDSHSYLAHYYFATLALQTGDKDHDAQLESSLLTSIKLNPAFGPSYDTLATFYGQRSEKLNDAYLLSIQAIQLQPNTLSYRFNAATILSQQRKYPSAINVLKAALPVTRSKVEEEMVQSRIDQLQKLQNSPELAKTQSAEPVTQPTAQPTTPPDNAKKTILFRRVDGKIIGVTEDAPNYPTEDSKGPQHTIKGILRDIRCSYPNVLALTLEDPTGKKTTLYTNNYYKVVFTTANYEPDGEIKPCTSIEDMKASIKYAEVADKNVAGQILAIELSK